MIVIVDVPPSSTVPEPTDIVTLGVSATGVTVTVAVAAVLAAEVNDPSVSVAVTDRLAVVSPVCRVRPASCACVSVMLEPLEPTDEWASVSVSVASLGMPVSV